MKMGGGLIWGIILIAIGLSFILRIVFDINIFRFAIAIILIFTGISMLIGKPLLRNKSKDNSVVFGEKFYHATPQNGTEYNTVFGRAVYDLRHIDTLPSRRTRIEVNVVFGSSEIILPPNLPVQIKADAVFASAGLPNGNSIAFGSAQYSANNPSEGVPMLYIEANVVFGGLEIKQSRE